MTKKIESGRTFVDLLIRQSVMIVGISIVLALVLNGLRRDGLTLPGDWSDEARLTLDSGETLVISLNDARKLFEEGQAVFLDARPVEDYETGHIQGAVSLPWDSFDDRFESVMSEIDEQTTLITYCDGPTCNLSHELAVALVEMGFPRVKVLVNGWTLWHDGGLPIDRSNG